MSKDQLTAIHNLLFNTQELHRNEDGKIESPVSFWELWCRIDEISSATYKADMDEISTMSPLAIRSVFCDGTVIEAGELYEKIEKTFEKN